MKKQNIKNWEEDEEARYFLAKGWYGKNYGSLNQAQMIAINDFIRKMKKQNKKIK
jgi:hypothetical protein